MEFLFSIESGKALGLLGRNGAGKTTTIRILMDVFKANGGTITIDGKSFHPKDYQIGYLLYAFFFGMLGALVSKTEDISKTSMPILLIYMASFFIAIFGMGDCDSIMMKVASFIPFTSSNAMLIRVAMGSVELWEVLISGVLLAVSCLAAGILAAKIFRFGTLMYGNPIKFTKALKGIKEK